MADRPFRLLPRLTEENTPFWTGGLRGALQFPRCQQCRYYVHPPAPVCPRCLSRDLAVEPVSGRGSVLSATVNHQAWNPTMPPPYVVALVEIDEQPGLRLMTNVVNTPADEVRIGQRVRVVFEEYDDVAIPLFEPDGPA